MKFSAPFILIGLVLVSPLWGQSEGSPKVETAPSASEQKYPDLPQDSSPLPGDSRGQRFDTPKNLTPNAPSEDISHRPSHSRDMSPEEAKAARDNDKNWLLKNFEDQKRMKQEKADEMRKKELEKEKEAKVKDPNRPGFYPKTLSSSTNSSTIKKQNPFSDLTTGGLKGMPDINTANQPGSNSKLYLQKGKNPNVVENPNPADPWAAYEKSLNNPYDKDKNDPLNTNLNNQNSGAQGYRKLEASTIEEALAQNRKSLTAPQPMNMSDIYLSNLGHGNAAKDMTPVSVVYKPVTRPPTTANATVSGKIKVADPLDFH